MNKHSVFCTKSYSNQLLKIRICSSFLLRVDTSLKGSCCPGQQTENHQVVPLLKTADTYAPYGEIL